MTIPPSPPPSNDPLPSNFGESVGQTGWTGARIRLVVLLLVLSWMAVATATFGLDRMGSWLQTAAESRWGPAAFIALYVVLVVLLFPGSLGTAAAGAVFGMWVGGAAALVGATIGALLAFVIARRVGRPGAESLLGGPLRGVDIWLTEKGFVAILILRLLPVVPFNGLNYAAGLSGLRLSHYVSGTFLGMIPGVVVVAMVADQADDPTSLGFAAAIGTALVGFVLSGVAARRVGNQIRSTHPDVVSGGGNA